MNISFVNDKVPAALVCQSRPLRKGEKPKHHGQKTVYEATGELNPEFVKDLKEGKLEASWKIDGTCCMIARIEGKLTYYRRRDLKGKPLPECAIPGCPDDGVCICWIECKPIPKDQYHLSALEYEDGEMIGFWTLDREMEPFLMRISDNFSGTLELVGPKVQSNVYDIPKKLVDIEIKGKTKHIPRHYLIPHGIFVVKDPVVLNIHKTPDPVKTLMYVILDGNVEGIVYRHKDDHLRLYKVNRGHIGCPIDYKNDMIRLAGEELCIRDECPGCDDKDCDDCLYSFIENRVTIQNESFDEGSSCDESGEECCVKWCVSPIVDHHRSFCERHKYLANCDGLRESTFKELKKIYKQYKGQKTRLYQTNNGEYVRAVNKEHAISVIAKNEPDYIDRALETGEPFMTAISHKACSGVKGEYYCSDCNQDIQFEFDMDLWKRKFCGMEMLLEINLEEVDEIEVWV